MSVFSGLNGPFGPASILCEQYLYMALLTLRCIYFTQLSYLKGLKTKLRSVYTPHE